MKDMMYTGFFLFIVSAIAGVLLAVTEDVTSPKILENRRIKIEQAQAQVLTNATRFQQSEYFDPETGSTIHYVVGFNNSNELEGIVIETSPSGYGGPIQMILGISTTGTLTGVKVLSHTETPGLGAKITNEKFISSVMSLSSSIPQPDYRLAVDGGNLDAVTAATTSSRAFSAGIIAAIKKYNIIQPSLNTHLQPTLAETEKHEQEGK